MLAKDIQEGSRYIATVNNKLQTVVVNDIEVIPMYRRTGIRTTKTVYRVTNEKTGRKVTFRSAAKFKAPAQKLARSLKTIPTPTSANDIYNPFADYPHVISRLTIPTIDAQLSIWYRCFNVIR